MGALVSSFGGGSSNDDEAAFNPMRWAKWRPVAAAPPPLTLTMQSAVVLDGRVYLFGGRLLSEIPDLSPPYGGLITFDSESLTWNEPQTFGSGGFDSTVPSSRYLHAAALVDRTMWVFGGVCDPPFDGRLYALNLDTLHWSSPDAMGAGRYNHAMVAVDRQLIMIGGVRSGNHFSTLDVEYYDIDSGSWITPAMQGRIPKSSGKRIYAAANGSRIYVVGCMIESNMIHVLDWSCKIWIEVPLTESLVGHQLCLQWGDDKVLFWNVCTKLRQEHERTKSTQICLVEGNPMSRRPVVTEGSPPTEVLSVMAALPDRIFVIAGAQVYWLDFVHAKGAERAITLPDRRAKPNGSTTTTTTTTTTTAASPHSPSYNESDSNSGSASMKSLVNSPQHSDVVIDFTSESKRFHAHWAILTTRSVYFRRLYETQVGSDRTTRDTVAIANLPSEYALAFLEYVYTGEVKLDQDNALGLLQYADYFLEDNLRLLCEDYLSRAIDRTTVCVLLDAADRYNAPTLRYNALMYAALHLRALADTDHFRSLLSKSLQDDVSTLAASLQL